MVQLSNGMTRYPFCCISSTVFQMHSNCQFQLIHTGQILFLHDESSSQVVSSERMLFTYAIFSKTANR